MDSGLLLDSGELEAESSAPGLPSNVVLRLPERIRAAQHAARSGSTRRNAYHYVCRALTAVSMVPVDIGSLLLASSLAYFAVWGLDFPNERNLPLVLGLMAVPLALAYLWAGIGPGVGLHPAVELQLVVRINSIAFGTLLCAGIVSDQSTDRLIFVLCLWLSSLILVPVMRASARWLYARTEWWGYRTLGVVHGDYREEFARRVVAQRRGGLRPVAMIDLKPSRQHGDVAGISLVPSDSIEEVVRECAVSHIILHSPTLSAAHRLRLATELTRHVPHVVFDANGFDSPCLWRTSCSYGEAASNIEIRNGLLLPSHRLLKRAMELGLILAFLPAVVLVTAVLALAVKCTSRGPVFYGQRRIGRGRREFRSWKFRTMVPDADEVLDEHLATHPRMREEWEQHHKLREDPRITSVGRLLRKTSLDELPQLWNVLVGEMSLVGPRPIVAEEIGKYGSVFSLYTAVVPGISGLWQVSGRNNTTYAERVEFDRFYIRNWSPWLDLYILARTVSVTLSGVGAY